MSIKIEFDWNKIKKERYGGNKLTIPDLIMVILSNVPIRGKIKLQKEVFLAWKEVFTENYVTDPLFHPDQFGPYSQLVSDSQEILKMESYIKVISQGEGHQTFVISQKGKLNLQENHIINKIPIELFRNLTLKKIDWDEWTSKGIMTYIYRNYPYYAIRAKIKELTWE